MEIGWGFHIIYNVASALSFLHVVDLLYVIYIEVKLERSTRMNSKHFGQVTEHIVLILILMLVLLFVITLK